MIKKCWKLRWKDHFRVKYADVVSRWEGRFDDDRVIVCNVYHMVMRALDSLADEPDILVKGAMGVKFEQEQKVLDKIVEHFGDR